MVINTRLQNALRYCLIHGHVLRKRTGYTLTVARKRRRIHGKSNDGNRRGNDDNKRSGIYIIGNNNRGYV